MGTVSQASRNMKAFVIVALVAAVSGEADPYTIGQVLAGQTNGGVLTSTTYHGGVKVAGSPYTKVAAVPAVSYAAAYPYALGKREAEAEADPAQVSSAYPYAHYPYAYGKREAQVYSAYPYAHYPYALGKREAEAEADPAQVSSAYPYAHYPYAYGKREAQVYSAYPYAH